MPSKRRPQARRSKQPRAKTESRLNSISRHDVSRAVPRFDSSPAKAFTVLARSRRTGESPEAVSRQLGTYFAVVRRHLRDQFRKVRGRWVPSKVDRLLRRKLLLAEDGYIPITVVGSKKAGELNRFNQVVARLVDPRGEHDPSDLESFKGKRIAGHAYLTDPDLVFRLANAGVIRTEELGSDQVARGGRK